MLIPVSFSRGSSTAGHQMRAEDLFLLCLIGEQPALCFCLTGSLSPRAVTAALSPLAWLHPIPAAAWMDLERSRLWSLSESLILFSALPYHGYHTRCTIYRLLMPRRHLREIIQCRLYKIFFRKCFILSPSL